MPFDPTTFVPPPLALGRRGMWWWEPEDYLTSPDECQAMGVSWIVPQAAVSFRTKTGPKHNRVSAFGSARAVEICNRYHDRGLSVGAFIYPLSDTPELAAQEAATIESLRKDGCDFVALDCEEHYEEPNGPTRAKWLLDAIVERVDPSFPLVDCPWAFIGEHPAFAPVCRTLAQRLSAHMPQLYTTAFGYSCARTGAGGKPSAFDRYESEWRKEMTVRPSYLVRPLLPIFGIFDRTTPGQPKTFGVLDVADIAAFEERFAHRLDDAARPSPVSYWSYHTATDGALDHLIETAQSLAADTLPPAPQNPLEQAIHDSHTAINIHDVEQEEETTPTPTTERSATLPDTPGAKKP